MIKIILILELIFRCEACYCIFADKAAESYEFFADQTVGVVGADGLRFLAFSETVLRFLALKLTVLRFPSF